MSDWHLNKICHPRWLTHFMELCRCIAAMSKDPSTKVGSVIVRPDRTIASTGYNGFPKACRDDAADYDNRDKKYQRIIHAEMNAILHAREPLHGYTLFSFPLPPCDRCMPHIIQAGITTVVVPLIRPTDRWYESSNTAIKMAEEAGVNIVMWDIE